MKENTLLQEPRNENAKSSPEPINSLDKIKLKFVPTRNWGLFEGVYQYTN
jgi:hypothetical protein